VVQAALFAAQERNAGAAIVEAELRAELARERAALQAGWRDDVQRLNRRIRKLEKDLERLRETSADQAFVLGRVSDALDAALSDDRPADPAPGRARP